MYGPEELDHTLWSVLTNTPLLREAITKWKDKPPTRSGGIYYSRSSELKWAKLSKKEEEKCLAVVKILEWLIEREMLLPMFHECDIIAFSLMWSNTDLELHSDELESCPGGFALLSLYHFFDDEEHSWPYTLRAVGASGKEWTAPVEPGNLYVITGDRQQKVRHGTADVRGVGKISIRLGFKSHVAIGAELPAGERLSPKLGDDFDDQFREYCAEVWGTPPHNLNVPSDILPGCNIEYIKDDDPINAEEEMKAAYVKGLQVLAVNTSLHSYRWWKRFAKLHSRKGIYRHT